MLIRCQKREGGIAKKADKMLSKLSAEPEGYAECYPGFEEMNDALEDSDDEADYSKMDLVNIANLLIIKANRFFSETCKVLLFYRETKKGQLVDGISIQLKNTVIT